MNCLNNCGQEATIVCCWKNIDSRVKAMTEKQLGHEIPYDYHPFCDKCASELYEKVKHQEFWINKKIHA